MWNTHIDLGDGAVSSDRSRTRDHDKPPWTWSALTPAERTALIRRLDNYVADYNEVFARDVPELVPPCWPQHPALAAELAVYFWLWISTHADRTASPTAAVEFYEVHLPRFRKDVHNLLGQQPEECRAGRHRPSNRHTLDVRSSFRQADRDDSEYTATLLGRHHFGLASMNHLRDAGIRP